MALLSLTNEKPGIYSFPTRVTLTAASAVFSKCAVHGWSTLRQ